MSLLTLLFGILSALAPVAGVRVPEDMFEPAGPVVKEVIIEPESKTPLSPEVEARMQEVIRSRCKVAGFKVVELESRGAGYRLRVTPVEKMSGGECESALMMLECLCNRSATMWLLRVHPKTLELLRDNEMQNLLERYEQELTDYESKLEPDEIRPVIPELPERLGVKNHMLVEFISIPEEWTDETQHPFAVLQTPASAYEEGVLITGRDVERSRADLDNAELHLTLTPEAGEVCRTLCRSLRLGQDRLAIVVDGIILCAPIVHAPLGRELIITSLSEFELSILGEMITNPIPVPVRVIDIRDVSSY